MLKTGPKIVGFKTRPFFSNKTFQIEWPSVKITSKSKVESAKLVQMELELLPHLNAGYF